MRVAWCLAGTLVLAACSTGGLPASVTTRASQTSATSGPQHVLVRGVDPYKDEVPSVDRPVDENGIDIYERNGVRYRHPVSQTQHAISLVEGYRGSANSEWLRLAEANAQDLIDTVMSDGVLEYGFDFPLHGDPGNTIHAPWRSAMAQGQFLSLTIRLWEATDDPYWRAMADQTLGTLSNQETDLWVTFTDDNGMFWLEEYAGDVEPMQVLNGHVFAMYGLYDYWQATGSMFAADLFWSAAETVVYYMPQWREPGQMSWYGLRIQDNPTAQSEKYHRIHIRQLRTLTYMTNDVRFAVWADLLESDFEG